MDTERGRDRKTMGRMCKLRRLDTLDNLNDILYVRIGGYIYIMYVYIYIYMQSNGAKDWGLPRCQDLEEATIWGPRTLHQGRLQERYTCQGLNGAKADGLEQWTLRETGMMWVMWDVLLVQGAAWPCPWVNGLGIEISKCWHCYSRIFFLVGLPLFCICISV